MDFYSVIALVALVFSLAALAQAGSYKKELDKLKAQVEELKK